MVGSSKEIGISLSFARDFGAWLMRRAIASTSARGWSALRTVHFAQDDNVMFRCLSRSSVVPALQIGASG
jgi:hypothetical protein